MNHFLQGKQALAASSLRPATPPADSIAHGIHPAGAPKHEHQVDVVKEGDKITRIVVTCACGETIEIECLYPAGR